MKISAIPEFIDRKSLTLTRAEASGAQIEAQDPQGDTVQVSRSQSGTGNTCRVGGVQMTVTYTSSDASKVETHPVKREEAYDLYTCLTRAQIKSGLDADGADWIFADLARMGGVGG